MRKFVFLKQNPSIIITKSCPCNMQKIFVIFAAVKIENFKLENVYIFNILGSKHRSCRCTLELLHLHVLDKK